MHIYTEKMQLATDWTDTHSRETMKMGFKPEDMIYTSCCCKQRPAKDCVVQCYYDGLNVWCAPEKGCKDPLVIADRKAREFSNRSAGQKARWTKASNAYLRRVALAKSA